MALSYKEAGRPAASDSTSAPLPPPRARSPSAPGCE